jgi:hypothetical protein
MKNAIFPFTYPFDNGIDTELDGALLLEEGAGAVEGTLFVCLLLLLLLGSNLLLEHQL